ncbi:MAG: HDOD domain-containing protein [Gammaproteobacteria bacterium]
MMAPADPVMVEAANPAALQAMARRIGELPLLPQVVIQLLCLDPKDACFFEKVLELVQQDPPFAVRLIRIANSADSAPVVCVQSLRAALTRLGVDRVRGMVTGLAVARVFIPTEAGQKALWSHAIQTALLATEIARLTTPMLVDPESAYLAGLLHDIGRFVMLEHATDDLRAVDAREWESPQALVDADLAVFRYTHSELGGLACEHWGLPPAITCVARYHHVESLDQLPVAQRPFAPCSNVCDWRTG